VLAAAGCAQERHQQGRGHAFARHIASPADLVIKNRTIIVVAEPLQWEVVAADM